MSLAPLNFSLTAHLIEDGMRHKMIASLPPEIFLKIFSYLKSDDLNRCCQVNREWNVLANDNALWKAMSSAFIFGAAQWQKYFGEVGTAPPLPPNIYKILQQPCPFWSGKRIAETHLLVLIPQTVNGKPLTLNVLLQQLIQNPEGGGYATKCKYYDDVVQKELGDQSVPISYWALMTKNVIPSSQNKTYAEQRALIKGSYSISRILEKVTGILMPHRNKTYAEQQARVKETYAIPRTLEIVTGILMYYAQIGERLYHGHWCNYTRCQEKVSTGWHVVVGAFGFSGLRLLSDNDVLWINDGVAGVRKF